MTLTGEAMKQLRLMKRTEVITVRVPEEIKSELEQIAGANIISLADLVNRILYNSVRKRTEKKNK